jgi:hypothetical protein
MANYILAILLLAAVALALWFDTKEMYLLLAALIVINSVFSLVSYRRRKKSRGS